MAKVNTIHGEMDDTQLIRRDDVVDTDNEYTTSVEYCLKDCLGPAHRTGQATGTGCFCERHVHRSVHVTIKQPLAIGCVTQPLT
jgi:hypothetical protein